MNTLLNLKTQNNEQAQRVASLFNLLNLDQNTTSLKTGIVNHYNGVAKNDVERIELNNGQVYYVIHEEDAYNVAISNAVEEIAGLGLDAFSDDFKKELFSEDSDYLQLSLLRYEIEQYINESVYYSSVEDVKEILTVRLGAEAVESLKSEDEIYDKYYDLEVSELDKVGYINYLIDDIYGGDKKEAYNYLLEMFIIDELVAEEMIRLNGIAHHIAHEDGIEIDLGDGYYAYRIC